MTEDSTHQALDPVVGQDDYVPYDTRRLSYANTFSSPLKSNTIRVMEWLTGKLTLLRLIRQFEETGVPSGQEFWSRALGLMRIDLKTPDRELSQIPTEGPTIIVANHPHGLVDGMVLAELIGRVRTDYRILTRSLLTGIPEIEQFMIPVPFPHEENALQKSLDMRKRSMAHLAQGGTIVLFPAGVVAASKTYWGPAIEADWNPFTSKMIQKSGATVVPIRFPGQNSRAYQIANRLSATLRQGLLLHEVVHALNRPQSPIVGAPIRRDEIESWASDPRGFVSWLRAHTLGLDHGQV